MRVLIGVDPHKSVHAAAAIDEQGKPVDHEVFLLTVRVCGP